MIMIACCRRIFGLVSQYMCYKVSNPFLRDKGLPDGMTIHMVEVRLPGVMIPRMQTDFTTGFSGRANNGMGPSLSPINGPGRSVPRRMIYGPYNCNAL